MSNDQKSIYKKFCSLDHPFPNKELMLIQKLHNENSLSKEDFETISELLHKYLNLRADVFHEI
jgi:hypothetical protein